MTLRYRLPGLGEASRELEEYTSSLSDDENIADIVVDVALAHVVHLYEIGVIGCRVASQLVNALVELKADTKWLPLKGYEDIFEALESIIAEKVPEAAGYIGLARSRNDHVAAVLRIYARNGLIKVLDEALRLRSTLVGQAKKWLSVPIPGFTHGQVSQVITIGHLLLAYEDALANVWKNIYHVVELVNKSPLGSSAGAGTTVKIDRHRLASLLGFKDIVYNTYHAVSDRSFLAHAVVSLAVLMVELSRIAEDIMVLSEQEMVLLPRRHIATSSVMPHKRNPVTLEVLRARAAEAIGDAVSVMAILKALRYSYNLDLQEANRHLYSSVKRAIDSLRVLNDLFGSIVFNSERTHKLLADKVFWGAEAAEQIAVKKGIPFRQAHGLLAEKFAQNGWRLGRNTQSILQEIGFNTEPEHILQLYAVKGSANPQLLHEHLAFSMNRLKHDQEQLMRLKIVLDESKTKLNELVMEVINCAN